MKVNIFKRPEAGGEYSYLAIPDGSVIPEEATNVDWETEESAVYLDENDDQLIKFSIEEPFEQIHAKGYAISGVKNQSGNSGRL